MPRSTMTRAQKKRRERMREAVELARQGGTLRVIARHLDVHWSTVARDLAAWAEESAKVSHLPVAFATRPVGNATPECDGENVVELRKQA